MMKMFEHEAVRQSVQTPFNMATNPAPSSHKINTVIWRRGTCFPWMRWTLNSAKVLEIVLKLKKKTVFFNTNHFKLSRRIFSQNRYSVGKFNECLIKWHCPISKFCSQNYEIESLIQLVYAMKELDWWPCSRDLVSINTIKQICVIVSLAFYLIQTKTILKMLLNKCHCSSYKFSWTKATGKLSFRPSILSCLTSCKQVKALL